MNVGKKVCSLICGITLALGLATTAPAQTPGADMWLRADVGVTISNGKVTHWGDQSGLGHHAYMTGTNVARQPQWVSGAINGLPVIRFGGTQSLYLSTPISPTQFTMFVVGKNSNPGEGFSMILGPGGNSPNNQLRWENGQNVLAVGTGNGMPAITADVGLTRDYHILAARYDGSRLNIYRNGALKLSTGLRTQGPWTLAQVGAWYSTHYLKGDLAEVVTYASALPDGDLQATTSYLRNKYFPAGKIAE
ncbi:LamG domain-containing protein [Tahibacter amnicola]|uniref:LamG domain-containing protein n=1 Tax=Tahibacter amnicola TaxID=2976241 RepID=A0ABY6BMF5_9GAMM|nr:LamG domain-containing protein [Tahibacter amnicola]UXI70235.1 LamG domain-containing protein [Tahibacter amnicola]